MTGKPQMPAVEHIVALHDRVLEGAGGAEGVRSLDAIAGAWGRAQARMFYEPEIGAVGAAATLAVSLAKAHGFADGNKRAAYGALSMTLAMNGMRLVAEPAATVEAIVGAAAGDGEVAALEDWLREVAEPDPVYRGLFEYDLGGPETP